MPRLRHACGSANSRVFLWPHLQKEAQKTPEAFFQRKEGVCQENVGRTKAS